MAGITLKVETMVLMSTADRVSSLSGALRQDLTSMLSLMARTRSYWIGQAGDQKRLDFAEQQENVDEITRRFSKYPQDLLQMAGLYRETENSIVSTNSMLKSDFISG